MYGYFKYGYADSYALALTDWDLSTSIFIFDFISLNWQQIKRTKKHIFDGKILSFMLLYEINAFINKSEVRMIILLATPADICQIYCVNL